MTKKTALHGVSGLDAPYVCGRPGRISTDQRKSCSGKMWTPGSGNIPRSQSAEK